MSSLCLRMSLRCLWECILNLSITWGRVASFMLHSIYPQERALSNNHKGAWVGPRTILDMMVRRIIPTSARNWILVVQTISQPTHWLGYPGTWDFTILSPMYNKHTNDWLYKSI
jgi:hypothetical protein